MEMITLTRDEARHLHQIHWDWLRTAAKTLDVRTIGELAEKTDWYRDTALPLLTKLNPPATMEDE